MKQNRFLAIFQFRFFFSSKKAPKGKPAAAAAAPKAVAKNAKVVKKRKEKKEPKDKSKNVMRELRIRKLCVDICVGESGDRLTRAAKVLEQLTGQQPVFSKGNVFFFLFFFEFLFDLTKIYFARNEFKDESHHTVLEVRVHSLEFRTFSWTPLFPKCFCE